MDLAGAIISLLFSLFSARMARLYYRENLKHHAFMLVFAGFAFALLALSFWSDV